MKVYFNYGDSNNKKKPEQKIIARLSYGTNKLDKKISTKISITKNGWNFKKGEEAGVVNLMTGSRTIEEAEYFKKVQDKLNYIREYLKNEFRKLKLKPEFSVYNKDDWNTWAKENFEIALGIREAKSNKASLFLEKFDEYVEFKQDDWSENTKADYKSIKKKFEAFEKYKKHKYRTNELDLNYYKEFRNWTKSHNISKNTFGSYIAKLKAVINHFRRIEGDSFKYHSHYELSDFKTHREEVDHEILDKNELELIWNYKGKAYLENVRDISKFLYYICLRWNEFEFEFKNRKGKHRIYALNNGYVWDIQENKVKARKGIPVHKVLLEMWQNDKMPHYISDQKFRDYIKELCQEVGISKAQEIGSHTFRRSFCTNMFNEGHEEKNIIEYSGHTTVRALKNYIKTKNVTRTNTIPTE